MGRQDLSVELPARDENGHLLDRRDWSPEVAQALASLDGVVLADAHWAVLDALRWYYEAYEIAPPMRGLVALLRERMGETAPDSRALYRLFPDGPVRQGCRFAGLPKPVSCI